MARKRQTAEVVGDDGVVTQEPTAEQRERDKKRAQYNKKADKLLEGAAEFFRKEFGEDVIRPLSDAETTSIVSSWVSTGSMVVDQVIRGGRKPTAQVPVVSLLPFGRQTELSGLPGAGKCLGRGTPVLRYDGIVVSVEDVKQGDLLMGPDSTPRRVLSTAQGVGPLYRILPAKGDPWVCNDVHVLTLVDSSSGTVFDMPLDVYLRDQRAGTKIRWKLFQPGCVEFSSPTNAESRPVTPYFLGVWLGDGLRSLSGVKITKPDAEIEMACRDEAAKFGLRVSYSSQPDRCVTYSIVGDKGAKNPLLNTLRALTQGEHRIPQSYLYAPSDVRLELLAGLIDTDGSYANGCFEFSQNDDLAHDVVFLARSLGFRVTRRVKVVNGRPYHRLMISGEIARIPVRIARKQAAPRKQIKNALRTGFSVHAIGEGEYFGFELDGDGRFLLGDFTVTHNTSLCAQLAAEVQAMDGVVVATDTEERIDHPYWTKLGVDTSRIINLPAHTLEEVFTRQVRFIKWVEKNAPDQPVLMLWDSLGGTSTDSLVDELDDDGDIQEAAKKIMMTKAKVISNNMEILNPLVARVKVAYVYTNITYTDPMVKYGDNQKTPGGVKKDFFASLRLRLKRVGEISEKDKDTQRKVILGHEVIVKSIKNSMAPHLMEIKGAVLGNRGFCDEYTVKDIAEQARLITTSGSWSTWKHGDFEAKFQGWDGFLELVAQNPEAYERLAAAIQEHL